MKLHETKNHWSKTKKEWVCNYCLSRTQKKYIATGHDHTDYDYDVCDCVGARMAGGKPYEDLK